MKIRCLAFMLVVLGLLAGAIAVEASDGTAYLFGEDWGSIPSDAEDSSWLLGPGVKTEVVAENAVVGEKALKVTTEPMDPAASKVIYRSIQAYAPALSVTDWTPYNWYVLDVYNAADVPVTFYVKIVSGIEGSKSTPAFRSYSIEAQSSKRIGIELTVPLTTPTGDKSLDFANMKFIEWYLRNPDSAYTLYIDNVRLVK